MKEIADTRSPSEFGEAEITELVAVFYRRVREDEMTGPMYPTDDWDGSDKRQFTFDAVRQ